MKHRAWLEVRLDLIHRNIREITREVAPLKLIAVVKANAYGFGAGPMARAAERAGAIGVAVFGLREAEEVRRAGVRGLVLNLAWPLPSEVRRLNALRVSQSVWSLDIARKFRRVHVKIDSGLRRVGVPWNRAAAFAERVGRVEGVFTTLAEIPGFNAVQMRRFAEAASTFNGVEWIHAETSASIGASRGVCNAARIGLALFTRRNAAALKAAIVDVKEIEPGEAVGYGGLFRARRRSKIAVVSCGYSDGLWRSLTNRWKVLIRGRLCPAVGRVSVNHFMVDVTGVSARPGDVVTVVGGERNSFDELARVAGTVDYEVYTRLPPTLPRVYL